MPQIDTIYFIHHSHTDVGYTHDQPVVIDMYQRFLSQALNLADKYASQDTDGAFRWTVENTYPLIRWLEHATPAQIELFSSLERLGRIEVTGMFANLTPLLDTDQLVESFQLLRTLRQDYGFDIHYGMNCDVNGENWSLVDVLLDLDIQGFSMAINPHFGGAPLTRPNAFWWQGPSGRKILAWNGWTYDTGWRYGIGRAVEDFEKVWWPRVEKRLEEIDYPLPAVMVQSFHPFGDNGSAFEEFSRFIDTWNASEAGSSGKFPRLKMATPRMWWAAVKEHGHLLPTYRGDWTDYWNFGCASSAREQTINRHNRSRLRAADALAAAVIGPRDAFKEIATQRSRAIYHDRAYHALHLWDEHTWGADYSVRGPYNEDTAAQWHHKADYAYTARSLSLLLQRDGLADLAKRVPHADPGDLLVFNPLPWSRQLSGEVPLPSLHPRGRPEDETAGRHFQDRMAQSDMIALIADDEERLDVERLWLKPTEVPGFGFTIVPRSDLVAWSPSPEATQEPAVENNHFRLQFDLQRGGITSWYDKRMGREWIDAQAGYPFNGFVHERIEHESHPWPRNLMFHMEWDSDQVERPRGWKTGWPAKRSQPSRLLSHRVFSAPLGRYVIQTLEAPGCAGPLRQIVFLPDFAEYVEFESWWEMGLEANPEATYLLFPFDVPSAATRYDLGGQAILAGDDQLPGVCRDYFTTQGWVDFANADHGVTIATPDNPMVQFGSFHFGDNQAEFTLDRAMLLGWVTNNYWETNFRAHQPGRVTARYRAMPYSGNFNEARSHRFGLEAAHPRLLVQHLGEAAEERLPAWPASGSLLGLPENLDPATPIMTLHVKPAAVRPGVVVRLFNASDQPQHAEVASGLLKISAAAACDPLERPLSSIAVKAGRLALDLPARRMVTLWLDVTSSGGIDGRE